MVIWKRKRVTVDFEFQGRLCLRVAIYWTLCVATVCLLLLGRSVLAERQFEIGPWLHQYGHVLVAPMFVLPLALLDCLIFSNRIAGPLYRLRMSITDLADGKHVSPIHLRSGDLCENLAKEFNRLIEQSNRKIDDDDDIFDVDEPMIMEQA